MNTRDLLYGLPLLLSSLMLSGCPGGGGGGGGGVGGSTGGPIAVDGPAVSGTHSWSSDPRLYTFNMVQGTPYSVILNTTFGDEDLFVFSSNPMLDPGAGSIGWSIDFDTGYDVVSFIATYTGVAYVALDSFADMSNYTLQVTSNNLTVDGAAKTATVGAFDLYYSFDAVVNQGYMVELKPSSGYADIGQVSSTTTMSNYLGSSTRTGLQTDRVVIDAASTVRHYIRVDTFDPATSFSIKAVSVPTESDLIVEIDSVTPNGANTTVSYTVTNIGLTTFSGDITVDGWANPATTPVVGDTGDGTATHTSATLAPGGMISGFLTAPTGDVSGIAYVIVDSQNAITEGNETNNVSPGFGW